MLRVRARAGVGVRERVGVRVQGSSAPEIGPSIMASPSPQPRVMPYACTSEGAGTWSAM